MSWVFRCRRRALVGALLVFISSVCFAAEVGVNEREILIGQSITLLDGKHEYGNAVAKGVRVYVDRVNAEGGLFGRKIVIRLLDDQGDAVRAEANAKKLVGDGVFALFGSLEGGPSNAVLKVANEAKVPFFGPMAGSPTFRRPHQPYAFPVRAEHREEFRALMTWGKTIGLKTVGFMHQDTAVGKAHLENVRLLANELGMQLTVVLPFKSDIGDAGLEELAKVVVAKQPDMVFNHGSPGQYAKLMEKARQVGVKTNFMAVNTGSTQLAAKLGDAAKGMIFAQVMPNPLTQKYAEVREYQAAMHKAGFDADLSYGSLEGYLTAKAMVVALRAAGRDLTRAGFIRTLEGLRFEMAGMNVQYAHEEHTGSTFVDLAIVGRDGRFVH